MEPIKGLITELLLRRTTAKQVMAIYDSVIASRQSIFELIYNREELSNVLRPLGLYSQRQSAIEDILHYIADNFSGNLPTELRQLIEIPHVGPYIANATRCFYLDQAAPIVDANIARMVDRFFGISGNKDNPIRTKAYWIVATALLPRENIKEYNWGLLDLGSLICRPKHPLCSACPLKLGCHYQGCFNNWFGLGDLERLILQSTKWAFNQIPSRIAEMLGLDYVPSHDYALKILTMGDQKNGEDDGVYELYLRNCVGRHYFLPTRIDWVWGGCHH